VSGTPWSKQEVAFMRKYYRNNETAWVARQLGRSVYSVRYKASDLNIKKAAPSIWRGNKGVTSVRKSPARPTKTRRAATRRSTTKRSWSAKNKTRKARATSKRRTMRRR
jgi:hypothetical protein